jgi:hypothetical protein
MQIEETTCDEIWIVEGQWDYAAAHTIIGSTRQITVIALPGANTFKDAYVPLIYNKRVRIILDNDDSGKAGMDKILQAFAATPNKPATVEIIKWPESFKSGYDLRDLYNEYQRESFKVLEKLFDSPPNKDEVSKIEIKSIEPDLNCTDFDEIEQAYREAYHVTDDMLDAAVLTLCSIYSNKLGGEQLWFRLIGPPGAGKTTIVNSVSAAEQVVVKSTFTGLFSGFKDNDDSDASLIPIIQGKTLIIKDADALLQQPNVAKIFSELRDFYDKSCSAFYKNRVNFSYENVRSTFILCGTQALRRADNSFLGERFLQFELTFSEADKSLILDKRAERALLESMSDLDLPMETTLKSKMKGFIFNLLNRKATIQPSTKVQDIIRKSADLVALMRTSLERDNLGDLLYSANPEVPTRLLGQLTKVAICVPIVLNKPCEDRTLRILRKIATATLDPQSKRFVITEYLMEKGSATVEEIFNNFDFSRQTINREVQDLLELGIVKRAKVISEKQGRRPFAIALQDRVKDLLQGVLHG